MIRSILVDSVVLFLLVYALLDIFTHAAKWLSQKLLKEERVEVYPVIFFGNESFNVEPLIRSTVREIDCGVPEILLVDLGLDREERAVAERLCEEYGCLRLFDKEQYFHFVEQKAD